MKQLIRKQTFETNSSSCHSLTLGAVIGFEPNSDLIPNQEGIVYLPCQGYLSTGEVLTSASEKINYFIADQILGNYPNKEDAIYDNLKDNESWRLLEEVVKYQTGAKIVRLFDEDQEEGLLDGTAYTDFTTIDHESSGLLSEIDSVYSLHSYIFNSDSYVSLEYDG